MAADNGNGGVLDLSAQEPAPFKVKLPDGKLYDLANPGALGTLQMQRFVSRYRRSEELLAKVDASEEDVEEMLELLLDCACLIVPDADRELIGRLGFEQLRKLIEHFSSAFPGQTQAAGAGKASTSAS